MSDSRVQVYWNSHRKLWSVRKNRKVILHAPFLILSDCVFVVRERGRQRVLREKRKNVHAWVEGEARVLTAQGCDEAEAVMYNPYVNTCFLAEGEPIETAYAVWFVSTAGKAIVRAQRKKPENV